MNLIAMAKRRKERCERWWRANDAHIAMALLVIGMAAVGWFAASMYYETKLANQRAHYSHELAQLAAAYTSAMTAKDAAMAEMARRTTQTAQEVQRVAQKVDDSTPAKPVTVAPSEIPELKRWTK